MNESARADDRDTTERGVSITLRDVAKSFGGKPVLRGLDLRIEAGQFVAIIGRSGCGKSTLLRLVAGLDEASAGRVFYGDNMETSARRIARVMFQEPRLLPWAKVLANIEIGLGARRDLAEARSRAVEALASVDLLDRAADWPYVLSGGQKQRVALARALVSGPRLLAFDEPLGALDALTRIEMQRLLENAWLRDRFTALLVTHDVAEAIALADRIILVEDGLIALDVPVDLPRPRSRGALEVTRLEERILNRILGRPGRDFDRVASYAEAG